MLERDKLNYAGTDKITDLWSILKKRTCDGALSYLEDSVSDRSSSQQVDIVCRAQKDVLQDEQSHLGSAHILWHEHHSYRTTKFLFPALMKQRFVTVFRNV